jgi:8-oxo-dGTP pyrophosphatase MutT (NUDIX family)
MITFDTPRARFNYRVAGVAIVEGRVLLHQAAGDDFWTLPGGRPEVMETAGEALRREMLEEVALSVTVSRLLWTVENFFPYGGRQFHELLLCFEMTVTDPVDPQVEFRGSEGSTELTFRWYALDRLHTIRIEPVFLRDALRDLPQSIAHTVQRG